MMTSLFLNGVPVLSSIPAIALGVICHVAVQNAVTSILVALLLSLIYYYKSYEKLCT
jgi:hypothetical protein